jgi:hypothetical protein
VICVLQRSPAAARTCVRRVQPSLHAHACKFGIADGDSCAQLRPCPSVCFSARVFNTLTRGAWPRADRQARHVAPGGRSIEHENCRGPSVLRRAAAVRPAALVAAHCAATAMAEAAAPDVEEVRAACAAAHQLSGSGRRPRGLRGGRGGVPAPNGAPRRGVSAASRAACARMRGGPARARCTRRSSHSGSSTRRRSAGAAARAIARRE